MKYAYYKTDGTAEFITTEQPIKYEQLRDLVGGNIEAYTTQHGEYVYLNEEGRLDGLDSNPFYFEDLRGNVVEFSHVDGEGESIGFANDAVLRSLPALPADLFEKGKKFTIVWISDSWGATVFAEIVSSGRGFNGKNVKPAFKLKGKRKEVGWNCNNGELMIFRGHDLAIKDPMNIKKSDGVFTTGTIRMNAMYNVAGLEIDAMRAFIEENQI